MYVCMYVYIYIVGRWSVSVKYGGIIKNDGYQKFDGLLKCGNYNILFCSLDCKWLRVAYGSQLLNRLHLITYARYNPLYGLYLISSSNVQRAIEL